MFIGEEISLQDMLDCRDMRVELQKYYCKKFNRPVISFCMNIPGPIKTTSQICSAFELGCQEIKAILTKETIACLASTTWHKPTGDELILCINENADYLKMLMTQIEDQHPLGRLFDIDVLDHKGHKISRPFFRKCLICQSQAQECARNRKHSIIDMQNKIEYFFNKEGI